MLSMAHGVKCAFVDPQRSDRPELEVSCDLDR